MHCFFIFDDRKNTRWRKAGYREGRNGSVSRKPNGAFAMRIGTCTARLKISVFGRASSVWVPTETGANEAWYHSSIMPKPLGNHPDDQLASRTKLPRAKVLIQWELQNVDPEKVQLTFRIPCVSFQHILSRH
jgi:hypothetical protein